MLWGMGCVRRILAIAGTLAVGCGSNDAVHHLPDAPLHGPRTYNCGTFTESPGWTLAAGFHAVVIADAADGLAQPVAAVVAGDFFDGKVFVVNQMDNVLRAVEPDTGDTTVAIATADWPKPPQLLTTITWDAMHNFDGNLYVGDQGADADGDATIFRVTPSAVATQFATGPGPGLDDIYGMAFSPTPAYGTALYVTGDTDGGGVDWGRFDASGAGTAFSELAGTEGIAFDTSGAYGGGLLASRPASGGYAGDDSITKIGTDGLATGTLVTARPGIHAIALAPPGPFLGHLVAASWQTGELISIDPQGAVAVLASGLSLTNYDGNILAFSPDGRVLYVADRLANRLVCIEPL